MQSIVAIHGLNGHREKTWTADNDVCWLRDLLPLRIPRARVISWGYDASTHSQTQIPIQSLFQLGEGLIHDLCQMRETEEVWHCRIHGIGLLTRSQMKKRPIIFITHSLGGIVLKKVRVLDAGEKISYADGHRHSLIPTQLPKASP